MDISSWVTKLGNFFTMFYNFSFFMETFCISICAVFCCGHLHLSKKDILKKAIYLLLLLVFSSVLSLLAYSLFPSFMAATSIVIALMIPGFVFLGFKDHGGVFHRIIKMTLFFSSSYVVTEIGHRVNIMLYPLAKGFGKEALMSLPYLLLILSGFLIGYFNINRFSEIPMSYFILNISLFLSILVITFLQSNSFIGETDNATGGFLILVLFVLLSVDIGIYIMLYKFLEKQDKILIAEAESKINEASSIMLKLNEESIHRSSLVRHDLKNHYAYIKSLLEEGKKEEAYQYVSNALDGTFEDIHIVDCGNTLISSIMNLELSKARMTNIELKYMLIVPPHLPFEDYDLCSLLSNLIDNALEEMERTKLVGYVDCRIKVDGSYLRIVITNPTKETKPNLLSAKKEDGHGYGIKIIRQIAAKYNGHASFLIENGLFTADVILDLTCEKEKEND